MILYHAVTVYQLLECIIHRISINQSKKAVLAIPDEIAYRWDERFLSKLTDYGFFDRAFYLPYSKINKDNLEESIVDTFDKDCVFDTDSFDEYYIGGVHYYITIYLIKKGKKVIAFEEANGAFSHPSILEDALSSCAPVHAQVAKKFQLIDYTSPFIKNVICDLYSQKEGFFSEKSIDFNLVDTLKKLSAQTLAGLYDVFNVDSTIELPPEAAILFTQHFMNLRMLSLDEQREIYANYIDYLLEGKPVYIKAHPDDIFAYASIFKTCRLIAGRFPSEFIPTFCRKKLDTVATIYSTSVNSISNQFNNSVILDEGYLKSFKYIHKYYAAANIISQFGYKWEIVGGDKVLLEHMLTKTQPYQNKSKILIIDDIWTVEKPQEDFLHICCSDYSILIFLNSKEKSLFAEIENELLLRNLYPLVILRDYGKRVLRDEIYLYTKEKESIDIFRRLKMEKHCGINNYDMKFEELTEWELKYKQLEGILKATEKRVELYQNKAAALEAKLSGLQKVAQMAESIKQIMEDYDE